jgi:poly(A) polymerase
LKINLPLSPELQKLFQIYNNDGDNLRIVGGAIRNFLLKKEITDIDLATKFEISKSIEILKKNKIHYIPTGIKYGTITALINKKSFEITTLRSDKNCDGRFADVKFVTSYKEDAKRRDFTINSLSLDKNGQIFDYFSGISDLKKGIIKFINDPKIRIAEDYLRILRFFRFFCYYGKKLDFRSLKESIKANQNLTKLSSDRVRNEFLKIISAKNNKNLLLTIKIFNKFNFSKILFQNQLEIKNYQNLLDLEKKLDQKFDIKIKFFILLIKSENLETICNNLNFSNKDRMYILSLKNYQIIDFDISKITLIKLLYKFDRDLLIDFLKIRLILSKNNQNQHQEFLKLKKQILDQNCPKFILNGNDLLNKNIEPKLIGQKLQKLQEIWIESEFKLTKTELLKKLY